MPKSTAKSPSIKIKKCIIKDLKRWALSRNEIGVLFFGNGKIILKACRIENVESSKRNFFSWNYKQKKLAIKEAAKKSLVLMAEGHSHPGDAHLCGLSKLDLKYFNKRLPHILVNSRGSKITAWQLKRGVAIAIEAT